MHLYAITQAVNQLYAWNGIYPYAFQNGGELLYLF
jgi:hypothetical protein